jgi:hypothetical protein
VHQREETEVFIELIKAHQVLCDLKHQDYRDFRKKDRLWSQIGIEIGENAK